MHTTGGRQRNDGKARRRRAKAVVKPASMKTANRCFVCSPTAASSTVSNTMSRGSSARLIDSCIIGPGRISCRGRNCGDRSPVWRMTAQRIYAVLSHVVLLAASNSTQAVHLATLSPTQPADTHVVIRSHAPSERSCESECLIGVGTAAGAIPGRCAAAAAKLKRRSDSTIEPVSCISCVCLANIASGRKRLTLAW